MYVAAHHSAEQMATSFARYPKLLIVLFLKQCSGIALLTSARVNGGLVAGTLPTSTLLLPAIFVSDLGEGAILKCGIAGVERRTKRRPGQ